MWYLLTCVLHATDRILCCINFKQPLAIGDKSNLTLAPYPDSASQFYTGGPYLYAYAPNNPYIGPVHINFRTTNQGCDHYGILNFSTTLQPICAPSHTFSFDGNLLVFSTPGSFKLCDDRSVSLLREYLGYYATYGIIDYL